MSAGEGSGFGGGVGFSVPLNLNQTPVSRTGTTASGDASTGPFFASQPAMQGPQDLLGGASIQAGGVGIAGIAIALIALAVIARGGR